jgi:hypothetical protein
VYCARSILLVIEGSDIEFTRHELVQLFVDVLGNAVAAAVLVISSCP